MLRTQFLTGVFKILAWFGYKQKLPFTVLVASPMLMQANLLCFKTLNTSFHTASRIWCINAYACIPSPHANAS